MAKSPLSTTQPAKTISISPLSYRPEIPGEERPEENILAEQALENMMGALERRKQKPFLDPTMLQLAAGFLQPTQTGSAFESIGNAARAYAGAKELERQREAEDIAFETGVLGQASAIAQSRARDAAFRRGMGGDQVTRGVTVKGSEVLTPPGFQDVIGNVSGVMVAQPNPEFPDSKTFLESMWREGKKSYSEALKEVAELEYKRYNINEKQIVDRRTGLGYMIPTGQRVEFTGANGSTYEIPAEDAVYLAFQQRYGKVDEYNKRAKTLNLPLLQARDVRVTEDITEVKPTDKQAPREPSRVMPSKTEREASAAGAKKMAEKEAETEAEQKKAIIEEGRRALPTISLGKQLIKMADAPDASEIYGLARNDKNLMAMFTSLIGSGIQLGGGYSISIPELSEIYRTFKLTPEQIQRYQVFLQKAREMAIKMSEFAKGSVSNYEQTLFSQASINENDLPGTIRMKAKAMNARAEFERAQARLLRQKDQSGKLRFPTTGDLYDSPEYEELIAELDRKYEAILEEAGLLGGSRSSSSPGGRSLEADILNEANKRGF